MQSYLQVSILPDSIRLERNTTKTLYVLSDGKMTLQLWHKKEAEETPKHKEPGYYRGHLT